MKIKFDFSVIVLGISWILLAGCVAPQKKPAVQMLETEVKVFHEYAITDNPKLFKFTIQSPPDDNALERKHYAKLVKEQLEKNNFVEVSGKEKPELDVIFRYKHTFLNSQKKVPEIGVTGYSSYSSSNSYATSSSMSPTYGVTGYRTVDYIFYSTFVYLDIYRSKNYKKNENFDYVYQAEAYQGSEINERSIVMPLIIKSIFKEFPGKSGSVRTESFPIDQ